MGSISRNVQRTIQCIIQEEQQNIMLSADDQLVINLEEHEWSDSLDEDSKKEYAIRIMRVISKLLK